MWVWRDETALGLGGGTGGAGATTPGWRLDAAGTWTWDDPSLLERAGVGVAALRQAPATSSTARAVPGDRYGHADVPAARGGEPGLAATPIFQALSADHSRRTTLRAVPDGGLDDRDVAPSIPEPHPGSGPLPIQDAGGTRRRGLAEVPTVPPPPVAGEPGSPAADPESPQDELRRRAERRRRPRPEPESAGGRHAMLEPESPAAPRTGRHAMR